MKLFTKDINNKLFKQYEMGSNLDNQVVVAKIFNPYGKGRWFLLNSDPQDPDYIWAIVQMGDVVEVGSVSRAELESIRVSPFRFPLERDLGFSMVNAGELFRGLQQGKFYKNGGSVKYGIGGMTVGRWYKDNSGQELRYIGENSQGQMLFKDGERVVVKNDSDFESDTKENKLFKWFKEGGELKEDFLEDMAELHQEIAEITLVDGSKISGEELRKAHRKMEDDEEKEEYAKGGTVTSLYKQFNKEKPSIVLIMIADDVSSDFMSEKFDRTVDWSKLSDAEKEKYNEDYRVNKASFDKYLMSSFVKLYYSDESIKEKCKGQSHKTIDAIKSVMTKLAKEYPQDKYGSGGFTSSFSGTPDRRRVTMAKGGHIESKIKERLSKSFDLPLQMAVYVPSTKDKNVTISQKELDERVKQVEEFLAGLFGGFNSVKVDGGFQSSDKGVINEDAVRVVAFSNAEGFESKFEKLVNKVKVWCKEWSQESMGLEFENDLFYIEPDSKFEDGGEVKDAMLFQEFKRKLPEINSPYVGENAKYKAKYDKYSDKIMYFKGGRSNSTKISVAEAYIDDFYDKHKISFRELPIEERKRLFGEDAIYYKLDKMAKGGKIGKKYTVNVYYGGEMEDDVFHTDSLIEAKKLSQQGEHSEVYDNDKKEFVEIEYAKGGKVKFADKVKAIKASLLKNKKVPKKVQKDYGKTYNAKEAEEAAKRIAGAMRKKEIK